MDDVGAASSILRESGWTQRKLFNVTEYYRMAKAGVFPEKPRVELIEGEILEMASIAGRHIRAVMALTRFFARAAGDQYWIFVQNSLRLDDRSEPDPDIVLLREREDTDPDEPPLAVDAVLVVEVADSSLRYDKQVKMPLYARHEIAEFWLVDVDGASVTVCRFPTRDGYAEAKPYSGTARVEALALPGAPIRVADIFRR